ncbi:MAG TPA: NarK family nitrate/nitrite MFS transporter [Anaeromyxobacter sp.]
MNDAFLFGVFPYAALAAAGVGVAARRRMPATLGTRSSEFLEKKALFWGSVPWHYAVLLVLAAHLVAAVVPGAWGRVLSDPVRLVVLEMAGTALGLWATIAMALLVVRRATSARLRAVTTKVDWLVLGLLLAQVAMGTWVSLTLRWGSVWYLHTAAPWLASLGALAPRTDLAAVLPSIAKLHAIGGFLVLALLPFSRLVHALTVPLAYLWRPSQVVVWNGERAGIDAPAAPRKGGRVLAAWNPEDRAFWQSTGSAVASRNLWISVPALLLAFAVWMVWSVVVVRLPAVGFAYTTDQLFWLAALPGLSGATLRIFYAFMVPIFGGRRFTAISTASLLVPALGIGWAVQDPATSYGTMLVLSLLCGLGGANFASSMANISFFFPKERKGTALGLNAGLGNLGVSVMQFVVPLVVTASVFGRLGGGPQVVARTGELVWLQNAAFVWVPFVAAAAVAAWLGMNDLASAKASFREQAVVFRRKHSWLMCWLYIGTFGSFIGFSAVLPLLVKTQFPGVDPMRYAFLGPLVGALARPVGGALADRLGGARVTLWNFVVMSAAAAGVVVFLPGAGRPGGFGGFLAMFLVLFATSGIGNGSTFRMIPVIFSTFHERRARGRGAAADEQARKDAAKEGAAVIGFASAIAAYGAFLVPRAFGTSMRATGRPAAAIVGFVAVYLTCIAVTWWFYARRKAEMPC